MIDLVIAVEALTDASSLQRQTRRLVELVGGGAVLSDADLEGFDRGTLQCSEGRVVADGGVYACPILAGLPGATLSDGGVEASFRDAPLYHPSCVTCFQTGMTCRNG